MNVLHEKTKSSLVIEHIRLPDVIEPGRYDANGQKSPKGKLCLGMGSGIVHMWGVFDHGLDPSQVGIMNFTNMPGSYAVTGNFSEWIRGDNDYSPHAVLRKNLGDPLGRLVPPRVEIGTWDITINVFENGPDKPPTIVQGSETNTIMPTMVPNHVWWTSEYNAIFHDAPFMQRGLVDYDAGQDHYIGTWAKTVQSNMAVLQGDFDQPSRTLVVKGEVRNCFGIANPATGEIYKTEERRTMTYPDENTKTLLVEQVDILDNTGKKGGWVKRDYSVAKRRLQPASYNVPQIGESEISLVALQRGQREARVIGQNNGNAHLDAAAGIVMLGPQWLAVFKDALRL